MSHHLSIGYALWLFGFLGSHRFYFGKPISGTIYFFTLGLLGIGWLVDIVLMPKLEREADKQYPIGRYSYTVSWVLLTFLGIFGLHRLYLGKWPSALLYFLTGGLCMVGVIYDFWTMNEQIAEKNSTL